MKAARIVYLIMNVIMISACIVLAVLGMSGGFNALYLIAPVAAALVFLGFMLKKEDEEVKKLMLAVFSAHITVVIALTQMVMVFKIRALSAVILIAISIVLVLFMIWALKRMFVKMDEFNKIAEEAKRKKEES